MTTTTSLLSLYESMTRCATFLICSGVVTAVPPYFWTTQAMTSPDKILKKNAQPDGWAWRKE
jgi:hypothetical protein